MRVYFVEKIHAKYRPAMSLLKMTKVNSTTTIVYLRRLHPRMPHWWLEQRKLLAKCKLLDCQVVM